MDHGGTENAELRKFKEAILAEIFSAYQESGLVYQKTADPEIRTTVLDLKRCYDRVIHRLTPLAAAAEKRWEELGTQISV